MSDYDFLYDHQEETTTRFVCFVGNALHRFDLAIMTTYPLLSAKSWSSICNRDAALLLVQMIWPKKDIWSMFLKLMRNKRKNLNEFLSQIIGSIHFTDI